MHCQPGEMANHGKGPYYRTHPEQGHSTLAYRFYQEYQSIFLKDIYVFRDRFGHLELIKKLGPSGESVGGFRRKP